MKTIIGWVLIILAGPLAWSDTIHVYPGQRPGLQEAISQARNGSTILVAEGIHRTDSAITVKGKTGLRIEGEGEAWIICSDIYANVVEIQDCSGVELTGIHARHEEPLEEYGCQGAVIGVLESNDIGIYDCELNGSGAMGVMIDNSGNVIVSGCLIQHNSFTAIYLYLAGPVSITHNRIFDNSSTLEAYDSTGIEIYGNVIANNYPY